MPTLDDVVRGQLAPGNIDLNTRPIVRNADGSISTVRSMSFGEGGREVLVPTISDDGRVLTPDAAIAAYRQSGKHLGMFDTPDNATAYSLRLHDDQARQYVPRSNQMAEMAPTAGPDPMAQIRAMLSASGVRPTTENLNRAMLAVAQQRQPNADAFLQGGENEQTEAGSTDNEQMEAGGGGGVAAAWRGGARPAASRPGMPTWDGAQYDPGSMGMGAAIGGMPSAAPAPMPMPLGMSGGEAADFAPTQAMPPMAAAQMTGRMDRFPTDAPVPPLGDPTAATTGAIGAGPKSLQELQSMPIDPGQLMTAAQFLMQLAARRGVGGLPVGIAAPWMKPPPGPATSSVPNAGGQAPAPWQRTGIPTAPSMMPGNVPAPTTSPTSMPGRVSKVTPRDAIQARQRQQNPTAA